MADILFWNECKKTLERDLAVEEYSTWIAPLKLKENVGITPTSYSVLAPNSFILDWVEENYGNSIKERLVAITSQDDLHVNFEVIHEKGGEQTPNRKLKNIENEQKNLINTSQEIKQEIHFSHKKDHQTNLIPGFTFDAFVEGKSNHIALAASKQVASGLKNSYNPLFIYGGVGLGKTHLLQAVGNELIRKNPNTSILYVTCERFTNDFISALRSGRMAEFKNRYRTVDVLLVDDIQFITGKEGTQEEFFHTFNQLYQNNKQIIISSDRPPKAIPSLENRLISRFECGMLADVGSPDFETRVAILGLKCKEKGYDMNHDILHHVATIVQKNVRELEGALNKIIAFHQFKNIRPTVDSVRPILTSFQPANTRRSVTPKQLIQTVSAYFDVQIEDILGKSRQKRLAFPRQIVMYLMREEMKASYPSIGTELGGRDHTTAMHAYDKISGCLIEDEKLQHDLELIKQRLYSL